MIRKILLLLAIAVAIIASSNCATAPRGSTEEPASTDSVSIVMLAEKEVKQQFGYDFDRNPFVSPNTAILRKNWDFIIARLTVVTAAEAKIELSSSTIVDKDNQTVGWFYDRETFGKYVASVAPNDRSADSRVRMVNWWAIPSDSFQVKPGKHEYILTFMGKHPVPAGLAAQIKIAVNGEEKDFNLPVPPQLN